MMTFSFAIPVLLCNLAFSTLWQNSVTNVIHNIQKNYSSIQRRDQCNFFCHHNREMITKQLQTLTLAVCVWSTTNLDIMQNCWSHGKVFLHTQRDFIQMPDAADFVIIWTKHIVCGRRYIQLSCLIYMPV